MKCLYHANCNDGSGAAMAVWAKYGDTGHAYIPCQYGNDLPDGLAGSDVIMVDFTAKKQQIRDLARTANSILIIDHHKTAQADLEGVDDGAGCQIEVMFDMNKSGAVLAWEWFHPDTAIPPILRFIQDRDLWRFKLSSTQSVTKGLTLHPDWRKWLTIDIEGLAQQGAAINLFLRHEAEKIVTTPPTRWRVTGDIVPVYNLHGFMISDTLDMALEEYPNSPYAVSYFDLPDKRVYSLRSRSGTDVDVSLIAARYGGGGHKHAAGFSLSHERDVRTGITPVTAGTQMNDTTQMFQFRADTPTLPEHAHFMVAGVDGNGVIYASGDFHPDGERVAMLCAEHDGVSAIEQDDHLYFSADWLEAELKTQIGKDDADDALYGTTLETLDKIRWAVRAAANDPTVEDQPSSPTDPSAR